MLASSGSYVHHYDPAIEHGSLPPSHHAQQYDPTLEFESPAFFTHAEQSDPALGLGLPSAVSQAQQYDFLLHPESPEGFRNLHQYNHAVEVDVPENSQHYDARLIPACDQGFQNAFQHDPRLIPAFHDIGIDSAIPETSEYSRQYGPRITPALPEGSEYCQQQAPLLYPVLPEGFQSSCQQNLAAAQIPACRHRQARGSGSRPKDLSSAGFQAQIDNPEGHSPDGFLQSFIAPIPDDVGTEAKPRRATREFVCSVVAAERNVWHMAMNKHGVYRPSGELQRFEDGTMQWREHKRGRWCKYWSIK